MPTDVPAQITPAAQGAHNTQDVAMGVASTAVVTGQRHAARPRMLTAHIWIARTLLAALATQIFFAGLGVFGVASFEAHAILGPIIILSSLAMPIVAWAGHLQTPRLRNSWILVGLMFLQVVLIILGAVSPVIPALHPVNAMLLVLLTSYLAVRHS